MEITTAHRSGGVYPHGRYVLNINNDSNIRMAVYGDSFGDGIQYKDAGVANMGNWWLNILANRLQINSIDNYCAGGTPFVFSYNNFMNNYKNYDINIVLVTDPGRYTVSQILRSVSPNEKHHGITLHNCDELLSRYKLTPTEHKIIDDIKTWHIVKDDAFMLMVQQLMVNEILRLAPKTIIIPCFNRSAPFLNVGLQDLHTYQLQSLGIIDDHQMAMYEERPEVIGCHFTPEMNRVVSDMVFSRILTGEWNWNFPKIKHEHPLEYYYSKKEQ